MTTTDTPANGITWAGILERYQWLLFRRFALFIAIATTLLITAPETSFR